jgi:hypothetical protein
LETVALSRSFDHKGRWLAFDKPIHRCYFLNSFAVHFRQEANGGNGKRSS